MDPEPEDPNEGLPDWAPRKEVILRMTIPELIWDATKGVYRTMAMLSEVYSRKWKLAPPYGPELEILGEINKHLTDTLRDIDKLKGTLYPDPSGMDVDKRIT